MSELPEKLTSNSFGNLFAGNKFIGLLNDDVELTEEIVKRYNAYTDLLEYFNITHQAAINALATAEKQI